MGAGHGHDHDDVSDDENENQDFFAGGEKSGLAVQNPDEIKRKILEKAKKWVSSPNRRLVKLTIFKGTLAGQVATTPTRLPPDSLVQLVP